MEIPENLRYSRDHEWVSVAGDIVTVGITDYAQDALGDVVFVEIPRIGTSVSRGERVTEVESTKSVSEIYAPVTGEVVEVNEQLSDAPETLNSDPYGSGWLFRVRVTDAVELDELLSADDYQSILEG